MLRNRMLADPSFLFKVGTEVSLSLFIFEVMKSITVHECVKLTEYNQFVEIVDNLTTNSVVY